MTEPLSTPDLPPNRSMPPGVVIPVLGYPDVTAAAAWLCRAFGFTERLRIADHRVQLAVSAGSLVGSVVVAEQPSGREEGAAAPADRGTHSVMVRVADADAHAAEASRAGARIVNPPTTYPFGERQYTAEDFAGHRRTFSQTVADSDPASWGGVLVEGDARRT